MLPVNLWESRNAMKALYTKCVGEACQKHGINRIELDILLFLANHPYYDTAGDLVEIRYLPKSQVSASIALLEKRGYLCKQYQDGRQKTAHFSICSKAEGIVQDGKQAQERFLSIMVQGIPQEELNSMKRCMGRMMENIQQYLAESR